MKPTTAGCLALIAAISLAGCVDSGPPPYGTETILSFPKSRKQVWAVTPALNLSGERPVDPLLQADLLFQQLQQVDGLTVIPVNRTAQAMAMIGI